MRRRKWLAALTGTLLVALFVALVVCWPKADLPDGIGPAAFRRITPGMSRSEVWARIGFPPGDYHNPPLRRGSLSMGPFGHEEERWGVDPMSEWRDGRWVRLTVNGEEAAVDRWNGERYWIHVVFGPDGKEATVDRWRGGRYWIHIVFGPDGKAAGGALYSELNGGYDGPLFARFRIYVENQWQKSFP
jgi:hypothetical protein